MNLRRFYRRVEARPVRIKEIQYGAMKDTPKDSHGKHCVFIAGATGYMGGALIPRLLKGGHTIRALARPGSERKLPAGCTVVTGNALDEATFAAQVAPADTYVHLVGVAHPSPWKGEQFRAIDLRSFQASLAAAQGAKIKHFVYASVAHPAPMMKDYIAVRQECESLLRQSGLAATVLRPWYVLGPGHRWPYVLLPLYSLCERLPATRAGALRLGMVTLADMAGALYEAIEGFPMNANGGEPAREMNILEVPAIRAAGARQRHSA